MEDITTIAIIGSAGRMAWKFSAEIYNGMVDRAREIITEEWGFDMKKVRLVSGGAAWSDHVAVSLFDECASVHLHFPCEWNESRFHYTEQKTDPGSVANRHHHAFFMKRGISSLKEIKTALSKGMTYDVSKGFHARNTKIAKAPYLIAFSFGTKDVPRESRGTYDTWKKCRGKKIHVHLNPKGSEPPAKKLKKE